MRSLTLKAVQGVNLTSFPSGSEVSRVAVDPESGAVYATVELVKDGAVHVDIVQVDDLANGFSTYEVLGSHESRLAPFTLPADVPQVVNLHYFPDDQSLAIIMAGGDIITAQLEKQRQGQPFIEVIGSVDNGVKAAAWSPDDEQLVYIDEEDGQWNLVCMTRTFDVISESPLRSDEFGEDNFINVGWGSKSTQFHGSLGKAAARASTAEDAGPSSLAHSTDSGLPYISFRGDAAYFAISSLDPYPSAPSAQPVPARRQIRIFSRDAASGFAPKLSATSESLPGLEGAISWRPSGNVLSTLVRYGYEGGGQGKVGRWDVAMLERNGLRHGGFELREGMETWTSGKVKGMSWNATSEVLAIWIEREDHDAIQLWTMKNYHYYLKQEITSHRPNESRFKGFRWHPEQPMDLYIFGNDYVQLRALAWDTYTARLPIPDDTATVVVVDGTRLLLTPFRTQNTPPPMSSYHIDLPSPPVHVALCQSEDSLAVLFPSGLVQIWDLGTRIPQLKAGSRLRGGGKVAEPKLRWETKVSVGIAKQVALGGTGEVGVLSWDGGKCGLVVVSQSGDAPEPFELAATAEVLLWASTTGWLVLDRDGTVGAPQSPAFTLDLCPRSQSAAISHESGLIVALSEIGKLHITPLETGYGSITLGAGVTSFALTPDFLIWTTTAQSSHYAPFVVVAQMAKGEEVVTGTDQWETRRIERGALAVVACPSSMSLVLQMPRGNLETIYPRPLVLAVVRRDVLAGEYRAAFITCRKHRLDINVIYDLAPEAFMANLDQVIEQIPEVDYLNLFLSSLSGEDSSKVLYQDLARDSTKSVPSDKINAICDALRIRLEAKGLVEYVETILTTHVCKSPPDYESGLNILLRLQAEHADIVEDAIKYIIFLSDVNKLFDVALGMYDFQLVLMVAQYSQKDPKEYLPFLRELRNLDTHEQKFRIDDHLGRREKALRNLHAAGPSRFEDAASYLSRYELFDEAFALYKEEADHLKVVHGLYGDYLYDRREFKDAATAYILAENPDKALKAYEKAYAWRELFTLARKQELSPDNSRRMCERVTDHLTSRGQSVEASRILIDYAEDVDAAVDVLCRGTEFAEASRLAALHGRDDLVESVIYPSLEDAHEALTEVFEEMDGQLDKEMNRLAELHEIRKTDPDTFYIVDNEVELENVDVATNATTVMTAFTRYTVAPTTVMSQSTRVTGQTAKSKHRPSKKRQAGRKGTVDEYDYLVASIGRLVVRVDEKSADAVPLLRHLLLASPDHIDLARALQATVIGFRTRLEAAIGTAWADREMVLTAAEESGGMGLGGEVAKAREAVRPGVGAWKGLGPLLV